MTKQQRNFWILAIALLLAEAVFFIGANKQLDQEYLSELAKKEDLALVLGEVPVEAEAVAIYDFTKGEEVYSKNGDKPLPIASIAKVMTVVTALNQLPKDKSVSISFEALMKETDYGFLVSERFNIEDLSKFTLIGSVNDGAQALYEQSDDFLFQMNQKAKKLGMANTIFLNPTGLDQNESTPGAVSSARDVNILSLYALRAHPEIFEASSDPSIVIESIDGFSHQIKNTNKILDEIPNVVFSKTGMTSLAGGNLSIIYKNKDEHFIAVTILGSTKEGRFIDMKNIVEALNTSYIQY